MAGTITVREVLRQASVLLQDSDPQFVRHTETELVDWLNDAQRAIYKFLPAACSRIDTIKLVTGTLQSIASIAPTRCKPGDGSVLTVAVIGAMLLDVICNMGDDGMTPGRGIRAITDGREVLDALSPNWHAEQGEEIRNSLYDPRTPRHFHVTPGVADMTDVWVRLSYVAMPLPIANTGTPTVPVYAAAGTDATRISVHDEHSDDLVNYICARALMKNAQYASSTNAAGFAAMFTGSINAKAQAIMGYNPNLKHLPFAPSPIGAA